MLEMWGKGVFIDERDLDTGLNPDSGVVRPLMKRSYSAFYGREMTPASKRLDLSRSGFPVGQWGRC